MFSDDDKHDKDDDVYTRHHYPDDDLGINEGWINHWRCRRVRIWVPLNTPLYLASYRKRGRQMMKYYSEGAAGYAKERRLLVVVAMT